MQSSNTPSPVSILSTFFRSSPSILGICRIAISKEAADANPEITGVEMKSTKNPEEKTCA